MYSKFATVFVNKGDGDLTCWLMRHEVFLIRDQNISIGIFYKALSNVEYTYNTCSADQMESAETSSLSPGPGPQEHT